MNFFKGIGYAVLKLFRSDTFKNIVSLGTKILKAVVGQVGKQLQEIAMEEVLKSEKAGGTGLEKYNRAYKAIVERLKNSSIRESDINLALEIAVSAIAKD